MFLASRSSSPTFHRLCGSSRAFVCDRRGSIGIIFGLTLIPLAGLTGMSVDYTRGSAVRMSLQTALDATTLALARDAVAMDIAAARQRADAIFKGNWNAPHDAEITSFVVTRETDRYRIIATAKLKTVIMQLVGASEMTVSAESVSGWGVNRIEIALVLDNTGSMGWSNKMQELKKALCGRDDCSQTNPTTGFIAAMRDAATFDSQIRVSLVPFDTTVRVPLNVQNAVRAGTVSTTSFVGSGAGYCGSNPTTARRIGWTFGGGSHSWFRFADRDKDTTTSTGAGCDLSVRPTHATWNGCIWDRDQSADRDTTPDGVDTALVQTLHPAVSCRSSNLARMLPLTDVRPNVPALINALAAMQPAGNTNLTIGTSWGANMLLPGAPMSTAAAADPNLSRFMILLTDGDNTENRFTTSRAAIDARTEKACAAAKAQGVTIYAIRVIEGNRTLLQNCASSASHYYEVANAAQLTPVFQSIAGRIGAIRLTQ